jgi:hypothetical protein
MDTLEITKLPSPTASPVGDVPIAASASCCATASSIQSPGGVRSWVSDRRVLAGAGLAVTGTGLGLGWDWLTAVGVAPLIISAAPCLIMCALGLCMMGGSRQASSSQPAPEAVEPPTPSDPATSP